MRKLKTEEFANVWDALADTPEESANLTLRSELMTRIEAIVKKNRWTQAEAAKRCGVTQPRLNDLLRGKLGKFSLDALVNLATAAGLTMEIRVASAA